jgi:hypothetical protein
LADDPGAMRFADHGRYQCPFAKDEAVLPSDVVRYLELDSSSRTKIRGIDLPVRVNR